MCGGKLEPDKPEKILPPKLRRARNTLYGVIMIAVGLAISMGTYNRLLHFLEVNFANGFANGLKLLKLILASNWCYYLTTSYAQ